MRIEAFSLGISIDYTLPAARAAKSVIVQGKPPELPEPAVTGTHQYQTQILLAIIGHADAHDQ